MIHKVCAGGHGSVLLEVALDLLSIEHDTQSPHRLSWVDTSRSCIRPPFHGT